jgi:hypothetical protein
MTRLLTMVLAITALSLSAQQPVVRNGRVDVRQAATIAREIAGASPAGTEPAWVGWMVPMVPGDRDLCSTWSDGASPVRVELLEGRPPGQTPSPAPPSPGPVAIERGTLLVVLARAVDGRLERLRAIGDDCEIDAGGRAIHWLSGITPAASVEYLDGLTRLEPLSVGANRRLADTAVFAIGLHDGPAAMAALERLTARTTDPALRRQAASILSSARGQAGFERVRTLIRDEPDPQVRRQFVGALAQSPEPEVAEALLALAGSDADAAVRGEAGSRYVRRAGPSGLDTALRIVEKDVDDGVRRRVVSAIGSLPGNAGTPALIRLARTHASLNVRKDAVAALGRSTDPSARSLLEELLK